ncbi:hypothetical protein POJ06DRAFT_215109 [Lipomyces tetrasporus]|uniref:DHHA2 domain-containing protein n=1 Tax=Lipomyces tetrasporus TaxID=54092 RepID=A0AAD7QLG1_9ASCO|nr:uncharacterized protein POJ06DRAFT_215109 [Lipomyces tetrasporus]KAJ8097471.1 hypothetical protein POJ06DRAFT_215109 [Lipomyces tetrasporus]
MAGKSIQQFLATARAAVRSGLKSTATKILLVTGNESADLDSFTSSLLFAYLTDATADCSRDKSIPYDSIIPLVNIPREEVSLRPELHYLLARLKIPESDVICKDEFLSSIDTSKTDKVDVVLVDHNHLLSDLGDLFGNNVVALLDHHADESLYPSAKPRIIAPVGSCTSLVVNYFADYFRISPDEFSVSEEKKDVARLALAPILVDTANLTSKATQEDKDAVATLISVIKSGTAGAVDNQEEYYTALMTAKRSIDSFSLHDIIRKDYKEWLEGNGLRVGISSSVKSLAWTVQKFGSDRLKKDIDMWAKERKLDAFVFMDSFQDPEEGYRRDLLVAVCSEKGNSRVRKFLDAAKTELKLEPFSEKDGVAIQSSEEERLWCWKQKNLKASRKQVAPLIRQFMQE